jgi:hypothetical protein
VVQSKSLSANHRSQKFIIQTQEQTLNSSGQLSTKEKQIPMLHGKPYQKVKKLQYLTPISQLAISKELRLKKFRRLHQRQL